MAEKNVEKNHAEKSHAEKNHAGKNHAEKNHAEKNRVTEEFIKYRTVISSLLSKMTRAPLPDIEDILQETYIRTYQSALKREIRFPKAFMVKTALRLARDQQKHLDRQDSSKDIDELSEAELYSSAMGVSKGTDLEAEHIKREEFRVVCNAINELPLKCRKVFILKKIYGLSQREIAAYTGLSESTIEKHVAKGLLKCVRYMDQINSLEFGNGARQKETGTASVSSQC